MTFPASVLAIVAGVLAASPAVAQVSVDSRNSPAGLRCSALAEIDEAERAAAIHFMAGYSSGERAATAFATVGPTDTLGADVPQGGTEQAGGTAGATQAEQAAELTGDVESTEQPLESADDAAGQQTAGAESAPAVPPGGPAAEIASLAGGPPAAVLPTVPVEAVLAACAQSPDSRIIDIIVAQGALGTD